MKNLVKFLVLCGVFVVFFGCSKEGGGSGNADLSSMSALERYERVTMEEAEQVASRSFASPTQVDEGLKVEGVEEDVQWLYAKIPDLGSSLCKKGGVWKASLFEYPTTFRSFGPESNVGTRSLMSPNPAFVGISDETR